MAIEISEKIRLFAKEALEDRLNVATISERDAIPLNERYNGMITTVRSEGKRYELLFEGDFEYLTETEKNAFLGENDNWKESNAKLESDIITVVTRSWSRDGKLSFKAILDDDIGIQEWEAARIYVIPHNDGYYEGEICPVFYVGKTHKFLKDDTEGSEEKGEIETGKLSVDTIEEGNNLEIRCNKPIKLVFKDPRHPDSAFMGPGQQILVGNLIAGNGSDFSDYGYDESGFPTKNPSALRHPYVASAANGHIYAENGVSAPAMEASMFYVSTKDGGNSAIHFRDEDENHSWATAEIEADPNTVDSNGRRSIKYRANKHIFQKEGVSGPELGEIEAGTIAASGNITAFSDRRLKENIKPIANALDKIKRIQGVSYTRNDQKDKKKQHIGVIAQDLLKVVPEVVSVPATKADMHSVDYSKLTTLLIEGMKEQQKEIELLKQEIYSLKGGK